MGRRVGLRHTYLPDHREQTNTWGQHERGWIQTECMHVLTVQHTPIVTDTIVYSQRLQQKSLKCMLIQTIHNNRHNYIFSLTMACWHVRMHAYSSGLIKVTELCFGQFTIPQPVIFQAYVLLYKGTYAYECLAKMSLRAPNRLSMMSYS